VRLCGLARLESAARALALPLVVLAEFFLMLLYLAFDFRERGSGACEHVGAAACRMERAGRQREVQGEIPLDAPWRLLKRAVKLHEVRIVPLQQAFQLFDVVGAFLLDQLSKSCFHMAVCNFHLSTS